MNQCNCGNPKREKYPRCYSCNTKVEKDKCLRCGQLKNIEYDICWTCKSENLDECDCGKWKQKKYDACFDCRPPPRRVSGEHWTWRFNKKEQV